MGHIGTAVVADGGGSEDGGEGWSESPTGIADKDDSEELCWTVGELSGGHVVGVSGEVLQVEAGGSGSETGSLGRNCRWIAFCRMSRPRF